MCVSLCDFVECECVCKRVCVLCGWVGVCESVHVCEFVFVYVCESMGERERVCV